MADDDDFAFRHGPRFRVLRGLIAFVVVLVIAFPVLFQLAIWIAPNRTREGYVVMPIGQAAFAMIGAPLVALGAAWRFGRPRQRRP